MEETIHPSPSLLSCSSKKLSPWPVLERRRNIMGTTCTLYLSFEYGILLDYGEIFKKNHIYGSFPYGSGDHAPSLFYSVFA